jgi:hypothetical protein
MRHLLRKVYGITLEDYDARLALQKGVCAICKQPDSQALSVDHDHKTKRIRGLLCGSCNLGLGSFRDDKTRLKAAILYLAARSVPR